MFFTNLKSANYYPTDKLQSGILRSIEDRLGFYCVNLDGELTSVVFAFEPTPGIAEVWFLGGKKADLPYLFKQFKRVRPDIEYITGQRKHRKIKIPVKKLEKYFKL